MTLKTRLGSMLLDHLIMCCISVATAIPIYIICFIFKRFLTLDITLVSGLIVIIVYFCKDILKAKSPAKRILGLQVLDYKTDKPASKAQTIIRNLTIPLWPIEVFFTLFSKNRRFGDLLAGTKVEESTKESLSTIPRELKLLFTQR